MEIISVTFLKSTYFGQICDCDPLFVNRCGLEKVKNYFFW